MRAIQPEVHCKGRSDPENPFEKAKYSTSGPLAPTQREFGVMFSIINDLEPGELVTSSTKKFPLASKEKFLTLPFWATNVVINWLFEVPVLTPTEMVA